MLNYVKEHIDHTIWFNYCVLYKKHMVMRKKKHKRKEFLSNIKVQLDYRTTITLKSMDSLETWLERYPNAKVIH